MPVTTQQRLLPPTKRSSAKSAGTKFNNLPGWLSMVLLFVTALIPRALYNCAWIEHRICHFGDAYNFLRSGSAMFHAVATAKSPVDVLNIFFAPTPPSGPILQAMTSMNLTERLLIDGPVFPAWLALIEWISGVNPINPIFDTFSVQMCLCNSVLDALCCVLVFVCARLAFNKRTALIAGLLFAFYPAAIINTQHCYSEPFSYFVLTAWLALTLRLSLRHADGTAWRIVECAGLGVVTGVLMLSKPAFVLLPPLAGFIIFALKAPSLLRRAVGKPIVQSGRGQVVACLSALIIGFALSVSPWLFFNKAVTGQWSLFVNRVPAFNIFHGNQLKTDGWRCYPYRGSFPGESKEVVAAVLRDGAKEPVAFVGLELKKLARLWSGVWNEYHYSLFGIPIEGQSLFHQLILFLSALSIPLILRRRRNVGLSRELSAGLVLVAVVAFHFAYLPFEAISRYAVTAMPAACILAAHVISAGLRRQASQLATVVAAGVVSFLSLSWQGTLASSLAGVLPDAALSPWIAWSVAAMPLVVTTVYSVRYLSARIRSCYIPVACAPVSLCLLVLLVSLSYSVQSRDWREWSTKLESGTTVRRTFALPATMSMDNESVGFILLDLQSEVLAPRVRVVVNGVALNDEPFPLARLMPENRDVLQCLAIQGEGMGRDFRGFRHWWVVPVSPGVLHVGGENQIELSTDQSDDAIQLFGDYATPAQAGANADGERFLPSLYSYSYTKGFTTFDHRDPRVFEAVTVGGKTLSNSVVKNGFEESADLSSASGIQRGAFRMFVLLPQRTRVVPDTQSSLSNDLSGVACGVRAVEEQTQSVAAKVSPSENFGGVACGAFAVQSPAQCPVVRDARSFDVPLTSTLSIVGPDSERDVSGNNPVSFSPVAPFLLPKGLPAQSRFKFSGWLKGKTTNRAGFVSLNFEGTAADGSHKLWNSQWQPIGIPLAGSQWRPTTFSDEIPDEILRLDDCKVTVLFSPFQPDYLFLRKKEALKCTMQVRDANFTLLQPLPLPPLREREWRLY
ncbi:MAG: glycosyltransferase family 39 protein [Candidatus Obscuribacterales bacterium]|nr:glycosyltransferase family 39 protein [Candidatus Obscuribacterales bacterium]